MVALGKTVLEQLLDRVLLRHWRWIDDEYLGKREGHLDPHRRALITILTVAGVLTFLYYIVLAGGSECVPNPSPPHCAKRFVGGVQRGMANEVPVIADALVPGSRSDVARYERLIQNITWSIGCFFFYFVIPALVVRLVFRERLRDHGLTAKGFFRHLWIYAILFAPVALLVWIVSYQEAFQSSYPFYKRPFGLTDFLVWELFYGLQFFSLEFFFRGFMLAGLRPKLGRYAIFAMVVPYVMIHFQKPFLETTGAFVAGTILGTLALRTRTIWGGVAIHVAVAVTMDVAALLQKGGFVPH